MKDQFIAFEILNVLFFGGRVFSATKAAISVYHVVGSKAYAIMALGPLGPLLFLIYINDFPNCLKFSDTQMYADDTSITMASECSYEIEIKMNADLDSIYEWLKANRLSLNTTKREFMLIA